VLIEEAGIRPGIALDVHLMAGLYQLHYTGRRQPNPFQGQTLVSTLAPALRSGASAGVRRRWLLNQRLARWLNSYASSCT